MKTIEKVEITDEHLHTMREKYDCKDMTDEQIINALVLWDKMRGGKYTNLIDYICFPTFQTVLTHEKNKK